MLLQHIATKGSRKWQNLERAMTKKSFDFSKMGEIKYHFCEQRTKIQQREADDGKREGLSYRQEAVRFSVCAEHISSSKNNFQPKT